MESTTVFMEFGYNSNNLTKAIFPPGYTYRSISRAEGYLWENIMDKAFGDYKAGSFEYVMVNNYSYLPERVYILFDEANVPCGTASAWEQPWLWGEECGYIIFVGVIPSHRGKGLATQMVRYLCEIIKNRGQNTVLLDVDSDNYSAIKSYLSAGFKPRLTENEQCNVWRNIFTTLAMTPIEYSTQIRHKKENPHPPHPYLLELREQAYDVN